MRRCSVANLWSGRVLALSVLGLAACGSDSGVGELDINGELVAYPAWAEFGSLAAGAQGSALINLRNVGAGPVTISRIVNSNSSLSVDIPDGTVIEEDGMIDATFLWSPTVAGSLDEEVRLDLTGAAEPSLALALFGLAWAPTAVFAPNALDFGQVHLDEAALSAKLWNTGATPLHVASVAAPDGVDVSGVVGGETEIAPGAYATITVDTALTALVDGSVVVTFDEGPSYTATLKVHANDCSRPLAINDDGDGDGYTVCGGDCDDTDPDVRPGQVEALNATDDDCNGRIDDRTIVFDDDGDCTCEGDETHEACVGTVSGECVVGELIVGDCNDERTTVSPLATAEIEGVDHDCDGVLASLDVDGDGYGPGAGGDCDDDNAAVRPGARELRNGIDDDCNEKVDDQTSAYDDDGDGYCEEAPCIDEDWSGGDCHDADVTISPADSESADGRDEDCDGKVDEGTVAYDDDGDGFSENGGDCDDSDPGRNPAEYEAPGYNGPDLDCEDEG